MIKGKDIYEVLAAIVPFYVATILGYGSIRWWKIFTPDQSSGINRFVAMFAIPIFTFNFISPINPYHMNLKFIAADTLQKIVTLIALFIWNTFTKCGGGIDWTITLFSLSTLPNTIFGVPLLNSMYGQFTTSLLIQIAVMQSIVWYNCLLFMYEYRAAKNFISQQFTQESSIITNKVESNHNDSLNGRDPLHADVEMGEIANGVPNLDGVSREPIHRASSLGFNRTNWYTSSLQNAGFEDNMLRMHKKRFWRSKSCIDVNKRHAANRVASFDFGTTDVSKPVDVPQEIATTKGMHESTDMSSSVKVTGIREHEIEDVDSNGVANKEQQMPPPAGGMTKLIFSKVWRKFIRNSNIYAAILGLVWSLISNRDPLHGDVEMGEIENGVPNLDGVSREPIHRVSSLGFNRTDLYTSSLQNAGFEDKMLRMHKKIFWRSKSCIDVNTRHAANRVASFDSGIIDASKLVDVPQEIATSKVSGAREHEIEDVDIKGVANQEQQIPPPASGMTKLILSRVWRKLIQNPNIYAAILGLAWSLISNRWNIKMPSIISGSISIMSKTGQGMAMFSLGIFMASQPNINACGKTMAAICMAIRFLVGPAVTAATSLAVGIRGVLLLVAIVQATIPQNIVPFVFAGMYNLHAEILNTAVIFGMVVAFPIALLYYVLLGL